MAVEANACVLPSEAWLVICRWYELPDDVGAKVADFIHARAVQKWGTRANAPSVSSFVLPPAPTSVALATAAASAIARSRRDEIVIPEDDDLPISVPAAVDLSGAVMTFQRMHKPFPKASEVAVWHYTTNANKAGTDWVAAHDLKHDYELVIDNRTFNNGGKNPKPRVALVEKHLREFGLSQPVLDNLMVVMRAKGAIGGQNRNHVTMIPLYVVPHLKKIKSRSPKRRRRREEKVYASSEEDDSDYEDDSTEEEKEEKKEKEKETTIRPPPSATAYVRRPVLQSPFSSMPAAAPPAKRSLSEEEDQWAKMSKYGV